MSCKNLKISEMPGVCRIEGSEIIPLVQEGENKVIAIKELVEVMQKSLHQCEEHKCGCEKAEAKAAQALMEAIASLDQAKAAICLANRAYDKAKEANALSIDNSKQIESIQSKLCTLDAQIILNSNRIDNLDKNLRVRVVTSVEDTETIYSFYQGINNSPETLIGQVKVPGTDITLTKRGVAADAQAVGKKVIELKSDIQEVYNSLKVTNNSIGLSADGIYVPNSAANYIFNAISLVDADNKLDAAIKAVSDRVKEQKPLTLEEGKFHKVVYDGSVETTVNIPTKLSHLDQDVNYVKSVTFNNTKIFPKDGDIIIPEIKIPEVPVKDVKLDGKSVVKSSVAELTSPTVTFKAGDKSINVKLTDGATVDLEAIIKALLPTNLWKVKDGDNTTMVPATEAINIDTTGKIFEGA